MKHNILSKFNLIAISKKKILNYLLSIRGKSSENVLRHLRIIVLAEPSKHPLINSNLIGSFGFENTLMTSGLSSLKRKEI